MITHVTDRGQVRSRNEDALGYQLLTDDGSRAFLAVADGMGGHAGGDVASDIAIKACRRSVEACLALGDSPLTAIRQAVEAANEAILQAQIEAPDTQGMGTTLTAALVWGDRIYIGHCGDSRAYLIRTGESVQLTSDHSVVGELMRNGRITADEAMTHPQRNLITQALGMRDGLVVETIDVSWQPGDVLLLCTDGLSTLVRAQEVQAQTQAPDFSGLAQRLVDLANARGGPDNITVLAARWEG